MALTRRITADKAGFCEHLDGLAAEHRNAADSATTLKARNRELGIAEGLEIARRAVEAWEAPASAPGRWSRDSPEGKLTLKALHALIRQPEGERYKGLETRARLRALADVAADVLGMAATPDAFIMAVREVFTALPHPSTGAMSRERAGERRAAWQDAAVTAAWEKLERWS